MEARSWTRPAWPTTRSFVRSSCDRLSRPGRPLVARQQLEQRDQCLLEYGFVAAVDQRGPLALAHDEPGVLEHVEVAGQRRARQREAVGDLAGRQVALAQQAQDLAPGRIAQGFEDFVGGHISTTIEIWHYPRL